MADEIDLSKAVEYVLTGPLPDSVTASKVVMYVLLEGTAGDFAP